MMIMCALDVLWVVEIIISHKTASNCVVTVYCLVSEVGNETIKSHCNRLSKRRVDARSMSAFSFANVH